MFEGSLGLMKEPRVQILGFLSLSSLIDKMGL